MTKFYNPQDWEKWLEEECTNYELVALNGKHRKLYKKKGYLHFDPRFWVPERSEEIREVMSDKTKFASWAFFPFLKVISRTPRFRYDSKKGRT